MINDEDSDDNEEKMMKSCIWKEMILYSQTCPRQLLRNMQPFILEEHLDIIESESGGEYDEVMHLERDDFVVIMLRMHQANLSRKRRLMVKNAKMERSDLTLSTFVQYVEDFRF